MSTGTRSRSRYCHRLVSRPFAVLAMLCLAPAVLLQAQQDELAVRAAYVFNLTKYVTWPKQNERLMIGVTGPGRSGPVLKRVLDGKATNGRTIAVVLHPSAEEIHDCDMVYVTGNSPRDVHSVLRSVIGRPILTVGEGREFARSGGMIGLVRAQDRMELDVNTHALDAARLQVSSVVLRLAVVVSDHEGGR